MSVHAFSAFLDRGGKGTGMLSAAQREYAPLGSAYDLEAEDSYMSKVRILAFSALRILAFLTCLASGMSMQGQSDPSRFSITIDDRCVGIIRSTDGHWIGTGFIADDPNTVITARHVAIDLTTKEKRDLTYSPPFTTDADARDGILSAKKLVLLKDDPATDIALLRIDGESPCKRVLGRSSTNLKKGDWVIYAGLNTNGHGLMISSHEILAIKFENLTEYLQIKGDARPGYSGGPVLDRTGGVVGVMLKGTPSSSGDWMFEAIAISRVLK
jgi:S1-C subfamily serine protease